MSDSWSPGELYLIHELETEEMVEDFDCGDPDLNDFIKNSAADYSEQLLATTYVIVSKEIPNKIIGYCSLANDTISLTDFKSNTLFNRFRRDCGFPNPKRIRSYPAVKVCRLGVDLSARAHGIGKVLLNFVKSLFSIDTKAGCRFVTVDAYVNAIPFYDKNRFHLLDEDEVKDSDVTRIMYFDLKRIQ